MKPTLAITFMLIILLTVFQNAVMTQTETENKAIVYLYRVEEANKLDSRKVKVKLNGKDILEMPEDNFIGLKLVPGKYELKMRQKQSETLLIVEAGKTYYVRVSQTIAGYGFNQAIYIMQPEQAVYQMRNMKPLEDKNLKDKSQIFIREKPVITSSTVLPDHALPSLQSVFPTVVPDSNRVASAR